MLYNIKLINTGTGVKLYDENLPFKKEPSTKDITDFISFIRPWLKYDYIETTFVRKLKENEN